MVGVLPWSPKMATNSVAPVVVIVTAARLDAETPLTTSAGVEPEEVAALDAMEAGDFATARSAYRDWLNRAPGNALAQLGLAQVELLMRIDGLDTTATIAAADAAPHDVALVRSAADCEVAIGHYESAFTRLISLIKQASGDDRKEIREHLVGLFALVDPADPILTKARQQLASALF